MKANNMACILPKMDIPQVLVTDFASDPLSQYEKVLKKLTDSSWTLHRYCSSSKREEMRRRWAED
jgi:hypothetical protein